MDKNENNFFLSLLNSLKIAISRQILTISMNSTINSWVLFCFFSFFYLIKRKNVLYWPLGFWVLQKMSCLPELKSSPIAKVVFSYQSIVSEYGTQGPHWHQSSANKVPKDHHFTSLCLYTCIYLDTLSLQDGFIHVRYLHYLWKLAFK